MNQISRFSVYRSLLRRNPFTRWSSKPISSSLISNNPTSSSLKTLISKFHHTFNYPPQIFSIPGNQSNHFRKFSGEPAAECNFDDADLKKEIDKVIFAITDAREHIELCALPPLDAVKIAADKFKALMEKLGLDKEKAEDYPPHLQKFREEIEYLEEYLDEAVAFGKYAAAGINGPRPPLWGDFRDWCAAGGRSNEGDSSESVNESETSRIAQDQIAMPVDDDASSVVTENLADNTNQVFVKELGASPQ